MEDNKLKIERFDGKDFSFWKMQIEDYLYQKNLYHPLTEKPKDMSDSDWAVLDRQALGVVRLTLSRNVAFNVKDVKSTSELMTTLSNMYEKPSAMNKVYLMRRLFELQMIDGSSAADHVNEFNAIIGQLSSVGIKFDDEVKALILLSSLPVSWDTAVTAISNSAEKEKLKFGDVIDLILGEGLRRKESGESSGGAYNVDNRGRGKQRNNMGRSKSRGRNNSREKTADYFC